MRFCGIDLHSNNCVVVITDDQDRVLVKRRCPNDLAKVLDILAPHQAELSAAVVESTYESEKGPPISRSHVKGKPLTPAERSAGTQFTDLIG